MAILGEVYLPLLTQDEVWRTAEGRCFLLEGMHAKHRQSVLTMLERVAPLLYADWVSALLGNNSDQESRAAFGVPERDPWTGQYPRIEVRTWFEAQPLIRRLRAMAAADNGCAPPLIDLLGQNEVWRTRSGIAMSLESLSVDDQFDVLRYLDQEAVQLYGEWLVEATEEELAPFGLSSLDLDSYEYGEGEARKWLASQPLVRRLRYLVAVSFREEDDGDARRTA